LGMRDVASALIWVKKMKWLSIKELVAGFTGIVLFGTVVASAVQAPFDPKSEMIFAGNQAVVLMPPVVVGKGIQNTVSWSYDGEWLFMESVETKITPEALSEFITKGAIGKPPMTAESVISFFDAGKQTTSVVWRGKVDGSRISQVAWLPGGKAVLFVRDEVLLGDQGQPVTVQSIYAGQPGNKSVQRLMRLNESEFAFISSHRFAKGGVIGVQDSSSLTKSIEAGVPLPAPTHWIATWVTDKAQLGSSFKVEGRLPSLFWGAPSAIGPFFQRRIVDPNTKRPSIETVQLNFQSGTAQPVGQFSIAKLDVDEQLAFKADFGSTASAIETTQTGKRSLWLISNLKSEHQYALVATDATRRELSPAGNAIYYETAGVGLVRPLASIPKDLALKALEAAERTKAMNDAKQAALALIMYASDYDDTFPSNAGDWAEAVNPYLKNREILDGFTYTYSGGPMSDIENPPETEIGFKIGPGGKAVAYADGHVKWIPDGKKEENLSALTRPCSGVLLGSMPPSSQPSPSSA
jgi:hypothetical protein